MRVYFSIVICLALLAVSPSSITQNAFAQPKSDEIPIGAHVRSIIQLGQLQKLVIVETSFNEPVQFNNAVRQCQAIYETLSANGMPAVTSWPVTCPSK